MENMIVSGGFARLSRNTTPALRSFRPRAAGATSDVVSPRQDPSGAGFVETSTAPSSDPHLGLGSSRTT